VAVILVIEDDPQVRMLIQELLSTNGYQIKEATNGQEGIDAYRKNPVDLVIIDIFLPEKGGYEVIQELTHEFPDVTIFAISGGLSQREVDVLRTAEMLGAKRTFEKPLDLASLLHAIHEELDEASS